VRLLDKIIEDRFVSHLNVHIVNLLFIFHEVFITYATYIQPYYLLSQLATLYTKSLTLTLYPANVDKMVGSCQC
jgi:hypothetical protein